MLPVMEVFLDVQWPWTEFLMRGVKRIETRSYPLPQRFLNVPMALLQTMPSSVSNTSSVHGQQKAPSTTAAAHACAALRPLVTPEARPVLELLAQGTIPMGAWVVGVVVFESCARWSRKQDWADQAAWHCVSVEAPAHQFGWHPSEPKYGWVVKTVQRLAQPIQPAPVLTRVVRSILQPATPHLLTRTTAALRQVDWSQWCGGHRLQDTGAALQRSGCTRTRTHTHTRTCIRISVACTCAHVGPRVSALAPVSFSPGAGSTDAPAPASVPATETTHTAASLALRLLQTQEVTRGYGSEEDCAFLLMTPTDTRRYGYCEQCLCTYMQQVYQCLCQLMGLPLERWDSAYQQPLLKPYLRRLYWTQASTESTAAAVAHSPALASAL